MSGPLDRRAAAASPMGVGESKLRTALVLLGATLFPLLIYAFVSTSLGFRDERRSIEAATLARAERISGEVDAQLDRVAALMRALGTARAIEERDWPQARERAAEIASLDRNWLDVALVDLGTGQTVLELRSDGALAKTANAAMRFAPVEYPTFGGIATLSPGRRVIIAAMRIEASATSEYLLLVALDPSMVQQILRAAAPREGVSAIVDPRGLFLARTKSAAERIGTPATTYVRRAMQGGASGIYSGVTHEGLRNFTAFKTSPRAGWSVHVALSSELLDGPRRGWRIAAVLAGLTALALAISLVLLILRLVTARRLAEERAVATERLEAVGKLTGGIAHDFNNMLAIVIGSLDLAQRRLAKGNPDVLRYVDNAMDGAHRAADLTRRLLAFSRHQSLEPVSVDVNALIRSTGELLQRTLPADIEIRFELQSDLWPTFVDAGQLENALVNLSVNARDAMPDGGILTISTHNDQRSWARGAEMVAISVSDTGTGMSAEVAARAFEPFYTTKEVGRGTGLGLSQIHGFATQSGGEVRIASQLDRGTTVTLRLPRSERVAVAEAGAGLKADEPAPEGSAEEIILLVEDEERVRRTNVEALRSLGYTVRHAADAQAALAILETQPSVRLVLTDIVMPGMSGRDLADRIARNHPDIRILLTTGYEPEQPGGGDEYRVLRKPFSVGELARRVRCELDLAA